MQSPEALVAAYGCASQTVLSAFLTHAALLWCFSDPLTNCGCCWFGCWIELTLLG